MKYNYDVSVILVNYNGKKYIDVLFDSLKTLIHDDFSYEVVFVDNNSSDDSVEYLESLDLGDMNLKIVKNKDNQGFAGGNNRGVEASEGKYVVLLNNDTRVEKYWLQNLYKFMLEHPDAAMANSKLFFFYDFITVRFATNDKMFVNKKVLINGQEYVIDGKFCSNLLYQKHSMTCFGNSEIHLPLLMGETDYELEFKMSCPMEEGDYIVVGNEKVGSTSQINVSIKVDKDYVTENKYTLIQNAGSGITEHYDGYDLGFCEKDQEKYQTAYELNNGCGASIIMTRENFLDCGAFDENFFMYYEDTDLSYRIKKKGKIYFCPDSIVRHIHTGSSKEWSPFFTYHVFKNKLLFVYKNVSKAIYKECYKDQILQGKLEHNAEKIKGSKMARKIIRKNRMMKGYH